MDAPPTPPATAFRRIGLLAVVGSVGVGLGLAVGYIVGRGSRCAGEPSRAPTTPEVPTGSTAVPPPPAANDAELARWVKALDDPSAGTSFTATFNLKKLGDRRAAPPLLATLASHADYYTRLGAAAALGGLQAADGVPGLIAALDDREALVAAAANHSLNEITGRSVELDAAASRSEVRALQQEWTTWWAVHEQEVRRRLGQAK